MQHSCRNQQCVIATPRLQVFWPLTPRPYCRLYVKPLALSKRLFDHIVSTHALFTFSSHGNDLAVPSRTISQDAGNTGLLVIAINLVVNRRPHRPYDAATQPDQQNNAQ